MFCLKGGWDVWEYVCIFALNDPSLLSNVECMCIKNHSLARLLCVIYASVGTNYILLGLKLQQ